MWAAVGRPSWCTVAELDASVRERGSSRGGSRVARRRRLEGDARGEVLVLMLVQVLVLMVRPLLLLPWDGMFQLASSDGTVLGFLTNGFCRVRVSIIS